MMIKMKNILFKYQWLLPVVFVLLVSITISLLQNSMIREMKQDNAELCKTITTQAETIKKQRDNYDAINTRLEEKEAETEKLTADNAKLTATIKKQAEQIETLKK